MAISDIGMFLPAESSYTRPGAYDEMLQAEALKRAAWLSSMDQFYENLAETKREFDLTLAFKEETRDLELDWAREQFTGEMSLEREKLDWEKEYGSRMLELEEEKIDVARESNLSAADISGLMEQKYEATSNLLGQMTGAKKVVGYEGYRGVSGPVNKYGQLVTANYGEVTGGKVNTSPVVSAMGESEPEWYGYEPGPYFEE